MNILEKGIYRHYKGNLYELTGIARHSETEELFAVYKALYQQDGENLWIRPLSMFSEMVLVNGIQEPRFRFEGKKIQ